MGTGFHLTGGEHLTQPVFCIVPQASTALWRSIRRWVIGTGWRGGIQLKVLDQAIDTSTPTGRLMFQVLGAVAEFEREMGIERSRASVAHRRATGGDVSGRRKSYSDEQAALVVRLHGEGQSRRKIQAATGHSQGTIDRILKAAVEAA